MAIARRRSKWWESGIAGIKAILELMAANPSYAYLGFIVSRQTGPRPVQEIYETGAKMLVVMIDRLREYGEWAGQPPTAARAALGSAEALVRREIAAGRAAELPRLLPGLIYGATVSFLGQEEALRLSRQGRALLVGTASGTQQ